MHLILFALTVYFKVFRIKLFKSNSYIFNEHNLYINNINYIFSNCTVFRITKLYRSLKLIILYDKNIYLFNKLVISELKYYS
jgi:hypothetical protein